MPNEAKHPKETKGLTAGIEPRWLFNLVSDSELFGPSVSLAAKICQTSKRSDTRLRHYGDATAGASLRSANEGIPAGDTYRWPNLVSETRTKEERALRR